MKGKLACIFFIFCLNFFSVKSQWVNIPDPNFVTKLQQLFPGCMNGNQMDVTCPQVVNATSLNVYSSNIADLTGVEYFINLETLDCSWNQLITLPTLPNNLQELNCSYNQIGNLSALPNSMIYLDCESNELNNLPMLPSNLEHLNCAANQLTILPSLPSSLNYFSCAANQISNLPLTLPPNLWLFHCFNNQLTSLPSNLPTSLLELRCGGNQLTYIPPLPSSLSFFSCRENQLDSLPSILPSSLTVLHCYGNQLTHLPVLPNQLEVLWCNDNFLTSLPSLPGTLWLLECNNNLLTNVPLLPDAMGSLQLGNNNIFCLVNLPSNTNIQGDISGNPLTCVPNQTVFSLGLPLCMDNDPLNNPNFCTGITNIAGYVYSDLDTNCNYGSTDWQTENIPVKIYDGQNNLVASSYTVNGAYSFTLLQPDTFVVKIDDITLPFSMDCGQLNYQSVILDSINQTLLNTNFPVVCDSSYDIKNNYANQQGWVFPGQTHVLKTNVVSDYSWFNLNCSGTVYSGLVILNITGPVSYVGPANNALTPSINGNTFTYNITDFNNITPNTFGLQLLTDTTAQSGDQVCLHVEIIPNPLDADTINNSFDFCYNVVNSYDPNMKEVYPVNVLPGYDGWFNYTIHFQNTGSAPAFNIRLRDTLDSNLDLSTFELIGYSHPAILNLNGNYLTVRFNNIMLPDSSVDYEGSMGFFKYRIKALPNLPIGTQIENTAYIYFDYNSPIVTNTTQNNFQLPVLIQEVNNAEDDFFIYPNPGRDIFKFRSGKIIKSFEVYNLLGEMVLRTENTSQLNLQEMPKGIYLVKVNGVSVKKVVLE